VRLSHFGGGALCESYAVRRTHTILSHAARNEHRIVFDRQTPATAKPSCVPASVRFVIKASSGNNRSNYSQGVPDTGRFRFPSGSATFDHTAIEQQIPLPPLQIIEPLFKR